MPDHAAAPADAAAITLPGEPAVTVEYDVPCRLQDGVTLRADVYRPGDGEGPWPVLLMRLPYDKTQAENVGYAHPAWYAGHDYLVAVQDCRGRGRSEGAFYPWRDETDDGYEAIEWAARLPGADGRVAMYGFSYAGATQLLPATRRPPSLAALSPAMTGTRYDEGWTYTNGALNLAFVATWATDLAIGDARYRGDAAALDRLGAALNGAAGWLGALPLAAYPPLDEANAPYFFDWLAHPPGDDYWQRWSIEADYGRIAVPGLHLAGWYDVFLTGTVANFVGLQQGGADPARGRQKLVVGPWHHMPWYPLDGPGEDAADHTVVDRWQVAWFDHVLKGRSTPLAEAPVTVYVMGEGRWRDFDAWPPTGSAPTPFYLRSQGAANSAFGDGVLAPEPPGSEPPDRFTYDPLAPVLGRGGQSCCYDDISPMGPADQFPTERWNGVLVYTSPPLERDLDLIGNAAVTLFAATSAVDTDWTARLCEVDADGRSTNLRAGIVRARYRDSLTDPTPLEPHCVERYEIPLGPLGFRIKAGHRLRLTVSSSDFPQWDRNLNTGGALFAEGVTAAIVATQTVLHDAAHPSCVSLPVMQG